MTTLANFLTKKNPKGIFYWLKFYWFHLLEFAYSKRVSNKIDTWKGIKIQSTTFPENMPEAVQLEYHWNILHKSTDLKEMDTNIFKYLQQEYKKEERIMKRFKD